MNTNELALKDFYIRTGANSQKMTTREITEFIQAEGKVRFDEIEIPLKSSEKTSVKILTLIKQNSLITTRNWQNKPGSRNDPLSAIFKNYSKMNF